MADKKTKGDIFIIEDDRMLGAQLLEMFQEEGYTLHLARSEMAATELFETGPIPRVILLDFMLPVTSMRREDYTRVFSRRPERLGNAVHAGARLLEKLRSSTYDRLKAVPVVVYSVLDNEEYRSIAQQHGAEYLVKGDSTWGDLRKVVERVAR